MDNLFGYQTGQTVFHRLTGSAKLIIFLLLTISGVLSFDIRYLLLLTVVALLGLWQARISWQRIRVIVILTVIFALLNLILIYVFSPQYGVHLFGSQHLILGSGPYALTQEQLLYEAMVLLKYLFSLPLALIFLFTTNPSQFSAGLNRIGVPYSVAYAVTITLRYIPNTQRQFFMIKKVQEARGYNISKKSSWTQKINGVVRILTTLIFSTLDQIDEVTQAMELRRFGKGKKRSWYYEQSFGKLDTIALILALGFLALGIGLMVINQGRYWNPFA